MNRLPLAFTSLILGLLVALDGQAHADEGPQDTPAVAEQVPRDVVACDVVGRTLTVTSRDGRVITRRDVAVSTIFSHARQGLVKPSTRAGRRVIACRAYVTPAGDARVVVHTLGRARYRFVNVRIAARLYNRAPAPVTTVEPTVEPPRPAAYGWWDRPTTVYAPVGDDWQVDVVLAAWNAGLPADRQVTRTSQPCAVGNPDGCFPVRVDVGGLIAQNAWGLAHQSAYTTGGMASCSIEVAGEVPLSYRPNVMAHEVGHCLGLTHWDHSQSVMSSTAQEARMPSTVDIEWIRDTYTH